jgi:hypothetical protein
MNRTEKLQQKTLHDLQRLFANEKAELKKVELARKGSYWSAMVLLIIAMMLAMRGESTLTDWITVIMAFIGGILFSVSSAYQKMTETWPLLRALIDKDKVSQMTSNRTD